MGILLLLWPASSLRESYSPRGYAAIAGVDEAGRGCLFGPVVAAAVVFPESYYHAGSDPWLQDLDDSKKLSPKMREALFRRIMSHARSVGLGQATHLEIDKINIRRASFLAMKRAIADLSIKADYLLVDGFRLEDAACPQQGIPKGDSRSATIAAASIVAKVHRDRLMQELDRVYNGYGIAQHKGYGTRQHYEALNKMGPTPMHRLSFNILDGMKK